MIENYIKAGFPLLWVQTAEYGRAIDSMTKEIEGYKFASWDVDRGFIMDGQVRSAPDPLEPIKWIIGAGENTILYLINYHQFIKSPEIFQALLNSLDNLKSRGKAVVIISPVRNIPIELDKYVTVLEFFLPSEKELGDLVKSISEGASIKPPKGEALDKVVQASLGLSYFEAENAFALSLVTKKKFDCEVIASLKAQIVRKSSSLDISDFKEDMKGLGGLDNLKEFALKIANSKLAKGLLLLGVPGTGKSHFAKALGRELGIPTLSLDFGRLFGSLVGESEERVREALKVVDAMQPCVLFIDEIEKGLGGVESSHLSDGGTGSRVFGSFLTWMNDHTSQVFVVATCNDIHKMPTPFLRAERWDAIFFVDLPNSQERAVILNIYKKMFGVNGDVPDLTGWSGAEIKSLCRIAKMIGTDLKGASKYVIPLSRSMGEQINGLRDLAKDRTIPASTPDGYIEIPPVRKIHSTDDREVA